MHVNTMHISLIKVYYLQKFLFRRSSLVLPEFGAELEAKAEPNVVD